jgi:hypothetical protein
MAIFSLIAKLGLDGSAYESGLKKASSTTDKFRQSVGSQLGAALSVAAIGAFVSKVIQTVDAIGDLSEQLNISTDDVQRLQVLAGQTGVSFEAMAKSITAVSQERLKAIEEGGKAREYFKTLGFSVAELNDASISNIDLISRMGQAHKDAGSSAQTQAAMIAILGEKAFKAAGAMSKIKEMGPIDVISKEQIDQVGKLADRMDEIQRRGTVAATPLVTYLGDQLESDFKEIINTQQASNELFTKYRKNNELYRTGFGGALRPSEGVGGGLDASTMPRGTIGTIDSRVKRETSMFSTEAPPGWVNTLVGQIKIQTNETRAIRVNTGRTAQAVE